MPKIRVRARYPSIHPWDRARSLARARSSETDDDSWASGLLMTVEYVITREKPRCFRREILSVRRDYSGPAMKRRIRSAVNSELKRGGEKGKEAAEGERLYPRRLLPAKFESKKVGEERERHGEGSRRHRRGNLCQFVWTRRTRGSQGYTLGSRRSLLICALVIRAACVAGSPNFVFSGHERVIPR